MFDFLDRIHVEKGKETKGPPAMIHNLAGGSPAPLALASNFLAQLPAGTRAHSLLEYCINNGIPCSTHMSLPQQIFPIAPPHLRSPDYTQHIPYRSNDYVFTVADFLMYENHC